jgi:hypothetical protein
MKLGQVEIGYTSTHGGHEKCVQYSIVVGKSKGNRPLKMGGWENNIKMISTEIRCQDVKLI